MTDDSRIISEEIEHLRVEIGKWRNEWKRLVRHHFWLPRFDEYIPPDWADSAYYEAMQDE